MGARAVRFGLGSLVTLGIASLAPLSHAGFGAPVRVDTIDAIDVVDAPLSEDSEASPTQEMRPAAPGPADNAPAKRYARLGRAECEAELVRRGIPFASVTEARGVLAPVRLAGALHGVTFRTGLAQSKRASSPWEIVDCRLALSLDDFAAQLEAHDIVQVIHYSIYRPPSSRWPADRIATRHPGALAIDAASFIKRDGEALTVEHDFHGHIGARTCGPGATPTPVTTQAMELRQILCDAADAKLFTVTLTPDYNWAHRNHFHLEVAAKVPWFLVH